MSQVTQVYGGDEINAIILDPGSAWTRAGWSAEDGPSFTISTSYADHSGEAKYGDDQTYLIKGNVEIKNPMMDGIVSDWEHASGLWRHVLSAGSPKRDIDYLKESPLFITEQYWNTKENQKKTMELTLEDFEVPAMYIGKSPVLSLFSAGRGSGIVVDVGAQVTSVAAVVDGFVLYRSAQRSRRAGNYLSSVCHKFLGADIVPAYEVASKERVAVGESAKFTRKGDLPDNVTQSFRDFRVAQIVDQFRESMVVVPEAANAYGALKPRVFEFPDGHCLEINNERYELGEAMFGQNVAIPTADDESAIIKSNSKDTENDEDTHPLNPWSENGITNLVVDCLKGCDVDARANLANNIVVVGGTTLTQGFTERINQDLQKIFPMLKIRIFASGNLTERKNSAWIGSSILASLGTFHQLWVTKSEYEEVGSEQLSFKRFK